MFFDLAGPYTSSYVRANDYTRHYTAAGPTVFARQYSRNDYYTGLGFTLAPVYSTEGTFVRKYATGYIGNQPTYSADYTGEITYARSVTNYSYAGNAYTRLFQATNVYNRDQTVYSRQIIE